MYGGIDSAHKGQYVRYGIVAFLALSVIGIGLWFSHKTMSNSHGIPTIHTATTTDGTPANEITFEVVTTVADQERGLGGRTHIDPNYAMLFVFPKASTWGFWMKDMQIPIDIIWVSDTGSIITIAPSVSPDSYPHVFYPSAPAQYVLEMRAGEAAARGWHVGSVVQLPLPYRKSISQ